MSSFYGSGGGSNGTSIPETKALIRKHISISSTQPNDQQQGDYWFVVKKFSEENGTAQESGG